MKYILLVFVCAVQLFAYPAGTTHTMRVTVNSSRVSETATIFQHQIDLSDSIAVIDAIIDSTKHVAIVTSDGATLKPKYVVYEPGKKFLLYWDGAKSTSSSVYFDICFGPGLEVVNSTSVYSNNNVTNMWGMDRFSGTTFYDYVGSNNGTSTNVDTLTSQFGLGAHYIGGSADNINAGVVATLSGATKVTLELTVLFDNFSTYRTPIICYKGPGSIYLQTSTALFLFIINGQQCSFPISGNLIAGTQYHIVAVFDGTQSTNATKAKVFVNGVQKTLSFSGTIPTAVGDLTGAPLYMGYTSFSHVGELDEFAVYDDVVSSGYATDRYRVLFDTTFYSVGGLQSGSIDTILSRYPRRDSSITFVCSNLIDSNNTVFAKINSLTLTITRWADDTVIATIPSSAPAGKYSNPWLGQVVGDTISIDTASYHIRVRLPQKVKDGSN